MEDNKYREAVPKTLIDQPISNFMNEKARQHSMILDSDSGLKREISV
jgi:hypothetical protein